MTRCRVIRSYFYPRSPCGERRIKPVFSKIDTDFYPRSPCGERRHQSCSGSQQPDISIHALLAESDASSIVIVILRKNFYPRSPCGERHCNFTQKKHPLTISIHALLAESDQLYINRTAKAIIFLSTLSLRRATLETHQ